MAKKKSVRQRIIVIILGLFFSIILLEIIVRLTGFVFLSFQEYKNKKILQEKDTFRILCLGESMTVNMYPDPLEEILNKKIPEMEFSVIDEGRTGTNSKYIVLVLDEKLDKYKPDMVVVMTGCNDSKDILPYGNVPISEKLPFKAYRLVRILWYNIVNKTKEVEIYNLREEDDFQQDNSIHPTINNSQEKQPKESANLTVSNYHGYIEKLGIRYCNQGECEKAEEFFKKTIEINRKNKGIYLELAQCYMVRLKYRRAEWILKKFTEITPEDSYLYIDLGWIYRMTGRYEEAEKTLKRAIKLKPKSVAAYHMLGSCYLDKGKYDKAEMILKKAIEVDPKFEPAYTELGICYRTQGDMEGIHQLSEKILKANIKSDVLYAFVGVSYRELGMYREAKKYFKKAKMLRLKYYNIATRNNYHKIKEVVTQRGIPLVCVQYPLRSIEPLKKLFDSTEGIIFVDNEGIFKKALRLGKYDDHFIDNFGGDFGYCTPLGNRLLAENVANVILNEYFSIKTKHRLLLQ